MAKVSMSTELEVPADEVWRVIGRFNALPDWHPAVERSEQEGAPGAGQVRRLKLVGGGEIVERLESVDNDERVYTYSIQSGPLPVANYTASIRVRDEGDGTASVVEWSSDFQPAGLPENEATKAIQDVYRQGLENLRKMFGG